MTPENVDLGDSHGTTAEDSYVPSNRSITRAIILGFAAGNGFFAALVLWSAVIRAF